MRPPTIQTPPLLGRSDLLIAAALAAAAIAVTHDAWIDIFRLGITDEELSYVLVAPLIIGLLAWVRRHGLSACPVRGCWIGILILAAAWLIYWYGYLADPVLWRGASVMLAVGAFTSAAGAGVLLKLWPAVASTLFLVPISPYGRYHIALPLQQAAAQATQWVCDLLGILVDRSGSMLIINGVDVAVTEACNGMRMVLTLFLICYVVAFVLPLRACVRIPFLLASPLVAIAANVIRLVPTVWLFGHASRSTAEAVHAAGGWIMAALAFLLLVGFFKLMNWARIPLLRPP